MTNRVSVLALGGSVAAAALVSQLRIDGFDGRILVVERDPDMPYDRPPLSKDFLASDAVRPQASWWTGQCRRILGSAESLDACARVAVIRRADGSIREVAADQIVIATGSQPVRLPDQPDGVLELRNASDARSLRSHAVAGRRVTVLGAGTIGTEVASSFSAAGARVTVVDLADRPLDRFLGGHLGGVAADWIQAAGVRLLLGTRVEAINHTGANWVVDTDRGEVEGDVVVCAVGSRPALSWLAGSEVGVGDGVDCDVDGRALDTSGAVLPGIYGIGDVASWASSDGGRRRREDWTSAQRQGRHVARGLLGLEPLAPTEAERDYFWSNQFGRRIQVLGYPARDGELVQHVFDPKRNAAFYTVEREGETLAWISINRPREFALAMRALALADS